MIPLMKKTNFPLIYGSPKDKAIFNPIDFINYKTKLKKINKINLPKYCIITFYKEMIDIINKKYKTQKIDWLSERIDFYTFKYEDIDVGIIYCGMGASYVGIFLEDLIAAGIEKFVTIGAAGALQNYLKVGDIVLATKSIRDEGTSYHYSEPSKYAYPSLMINRYIKKVLKDKKIKYYDGATWTTDAPYRETIKKAKKYKSEGILCVEMEASALFAIAKYRNKSIGALFYISDILSDLKWNPQFHSKHVELGKSILLDVAMDTFYQMNKKLK